MGNNKEVDLLDLLHQTIGCKYLSDLQISPYREKAIEAFKRMDLSEFSQKQIIDAKQYLRIADS